MQQRYAKLLAFLGLSLFGCVNLVACGGAGMDTGVVLDFTKAPTFTDSERRVILTLSPLPPPPKSPSNRYADDPKAAQLGQYLFYDTGLSKNGKVSCATCHSPASDWGDQKALSQGVSTLMRHSPTLWNVAYNRWFYWDGRADSLWSQALSPLEASKEMASTRLEVLHYIAKNDRLRKAYIAVFGEFPKVSDSKRFPPKGRPKPDQKESVEHKAWTSMSPDDQTLVNRVFANVGKAIAAYERKILSKEAPFDRFVEGLKENNPEKQKAISNEAKWGLQIFLMKDSCIACHNGPNFSDKEFHNIGLGKNVVLPKPDIGRFDGIPAVLTNIFNGLGKFSDDTKHQAHDKLRFLKDDPQETVSTFGEMKTPTLRNISLSGPYMHDGRFQSLDGVLTYYSLFGAKDPSLCIANRQAVRQPQGCQLIEPAIGHREETMMVLKLSPDQRQALKAFLGTLTGKALSPSLLKPPIQLPQE